MQSKEKYEILKELIKSNRWEINLETGIIIGQKGIAGRPDKKGYLTFSTTYKRKVYNFKNHQIVAMAGGLEFLGFTINHKNGIKKQNMFSNLEVMTYSEQNYHAYKIGLKTPNNKSINRGEKNSNSKLSNNDVKKIKKSLIDNVPVKVLSEKYNVSLATIYFIKSGKLWGWLYV